MAHALRGNSLRIPLGRVWVPRIESVSMNQIPGN
jgi:hypothetical protein